MSDSSPSRPSRPAAGPVALVGMMAVGKTSVGVALARRLGCPFVDLDAELVARQGRPIAEIFETEGEDHFRALESELLAEMLDRIDGPVLSTGGGVVKVPSNRQGLRERATTVWLRCRPATIVARAQGNPDRPLLRPSDAEDFSTLVNRLDSERQPLYAEVADLVLDTDDSPVDELAARLADLLGCRGVS